MFKEAGRSSKGFTTTIEERKGAREKSDNRLNKKQDFNEVVMVHLGNVILWVFFGSKIYYFINMCNDRKSALL